jgi:dihydrofolate reductase
MQKYVVSTTADPTSWNNTQAITAEPATTIRRLKQDTAGDILVDGSGQLVDFLLQEDLVDQLNLLVFPELYGKGKHLFRDGARRTLTVTSCTPLHAGALHLIYDVKHD